MKPPARYPQSDYKVLKKESYMDFDLFKLDFHETMKKVMYFKGKKVKVLFDELLVEVCSHLNLSKWALANYVAEGFSCNLVTIQRFFYSKCHFPVYLTKHLILKLPKNKQVYFFDEFNSKTEKLKFGVSHTWINFPKRINAELAWICGAVAADGWITREKKTRREKMGIVDQNKKTVLKAQKYFKKVFNCRTKFRRDYCEDCWHLIIDSISVTRLFTTFLGFHYGVKAHDICEPQVVKSSEFRTNFASGVMSFDGSVELDGKISLGVKSKQLAIDVQDILLVGGLSTKISRNKQGLYIMKSGSLLNNKDINKWVNFFDVKTEKGYRLYYLTHGFTRVAKGESEAIDSLVKFSRYPKTRPCPIYKIFKILKIKKSVKKQDLQKFAGIGHATLYKYTWLLRKANIVHCDDGYFGRGHFNFYEFNPNVSEWRLPMAF